MNRARQDMMDTEWKRKQKKDTEQLCPMSSKRLKAEMEIKHHAQVRIKNEMGVLHH